MRKRVLYFIAIIIFAACNYATAADVSAIREMDPVTQLVNYVSLGEWNTDGNFESWTYNSHMADCGVYGGSITGRVSGDDSHIDLTLADAGKSVNLISGSVVEIRCRYDANSINTIGRWYLNGGTWQLAFINEAGEQPTDGAFHIFRATIIADVGNVTAFRIDQYKSGSIGSTFSVDYVRVVTAETAVVNSMISHGPMLGTVSETNAKIWIRTSVPTNVTFTLSEFPFGSNFLSRVIYTTSESDNTGVINFDNLDIGTEYQYEVFAGDTTNQGSFITLSPSLTNQTIRLIYGYGYEPDEDVMPPGTSIYMNMHARKPDLIMFLGDFPYCLLGEREELIEGNKELRSIIGFTELTDSTPTYGIYDDHDFGPNDCDGTHSNADIALKTFKDYWANPSYGLPTNKGIYSSFVVGNVEFFLLDGRYNARFSENTMLGTIQFDWLCNKLKNSGSRFKVLVSGTQFGRVKDDGWPGEYYIDERNRLFNFIYENNIPGVFGISGDVHRNDIFKLPIGGNRFFYDFTPGSLARHHRSPPADWPVGMIYSYGVGDVDNMFGEIDFRPASDTNAAIIFRSFSGIDGLTYEHILSPDDLDGEADVIATRETDPTNNLQSYVSLGEWNTEGDFEGWSYNSNITACAVIGGSITGKVSGNDEHIDLNLTNAGKYVSMSAGSVVEIRCRYEAGTSNNLGQYFLNDGFWQLSFITNINEQPTDGNFHVYRATIIPKVGDLTSFKFDQFATNQSGETFEVDYIRVKSSKMIDPTDAPDMKYYYISLAEWNTDGDFENWTLNNANEQSVSNELLTATGAGNGDCQIVKSDAEGLPAVDIDKHKIVELRLKSHASTTKLDLFYATVNNPELSEERCVKIEGVLIPQDEKYHVYRLDLSNESYWEGTLKTFRLDPVSSTGTTFQVDYIRVGKIAPVPEPAMFGLLSLLGIGRLKMK